MIGWYDEITSWDSEYGFLQDAMARATLLNQPSWQKRMRWRPEPPDPNKSLIERINANLKRQPWTA